MKKWLLSLVKPTVVALVWEIVQEVKKYSGEVTIQDVERWVNEKL